jgi:DNA-binding IclR family transcriptional regulator
MRRLDRRYLSPPTRLVLDLAEAASEPIDYAKVQEIARRAGLPPCTARHTLVRFGFIGADEAQRA